MKISKTAWLILGIGIFVIAVASLYMVYFQQGREQERLNDSLSVAQQTLPELASEKDDWERQLTQLGSQLAQLKSELAQATSRLADSKTRFPKSVASIEYGERLFRIADGCDLVITEFTSSEPGDKKVEVEVGDINVEDVTYFVTLFTVVVESKDAGYSDKTIVDNMLDFINTIATSDYFASATIELVNMDIPEPVAEEEEKPSATITLVIYGYKGE